jgi:2Fe-2S ferredoxin
MPKTQLSSTELIAIEIIDREEKNHKIEIPSGVELNMMEICTAAELPLNSFCGGLALCGHCHVYVLSNHVLPVKTHQEEETLDKLVNTKSNSRLGCQIKINNALHGLKLQLAPVE